MVIDEVRARIEAELTRIGATEYERRAAKLLLSRPDGEARVKHFIDEIRPVHARLCCGGVIVEPGGRCPVCTDPADD